MVRQTPVAVARPGKRFARGEVQANAGANKIVRRSSGRDGARALSSASDAIQAPPRLLLAKLLSYSDPIVHYCVMSFAAQSAVQPANPQRGLTFRWPKTVQHRQPSQLPLGKDPTGSYSGSRRNFRVSARLVARRWGRKAVVHTRITANFVNFRGLSFLLRAQNTPPVR
jgi:hypothetical protein